MAQKITDVTVEIFQDSHGTSEIRMDGFAVSPRLDVKPIMRTAVFADLQQILIALGSKRTCFVSVCMGCRKAYSVFYGPHNGFDLATTHGYCPTCEAKYPA